MPKVLQVIAGAVVLLGLLSVSSSATGGTSSNPLLLVALGVYALSRLRAPKAVAPLAGDTTAQSPATFSQLTGHNQSGEQVYLYIDQIFQQEFVLEQEADQQMIQGSQLGDVHLVHANTALLIVPLTGVTQRICQQAGNYYKLLQHIPSCFASYNRNYIEQLLEQVTTWQVSGTIALKDKECLSWGSSVWQHGLAADFASEQDCIKSQQLPLFATWEPEEAVDFYPQGEDGLAFDKLWRPLVSQSELLAYSRGHCWSQVEE